MFYHHSDDRVTLLKTCEEVVRGRYSTIEVVGGDLHFSDGLLGSIRMIDYIVPIRINLSYFAELPRKSSG